MNDLVTIIMPVWNIREKFLVQSLKSILEQSYLNFELLIVVEKTNTEIDKKIQNVLEKFSHNKKIKIIYPEKKGLANSLNEGILKAKGKFIARMDADDISEKNRLEEQVKYLEDNNVDLVGSWALSISEEGKILGTIEPPITNVEIRKKIMFHNPFLHPSIFFRKSIIETVGGYDSLYNGAEDYDLYFRIISKGFSVGNIPKLLIRLRETNDSVMRSKNWKKNRKINYEVKKNAVKNLGFNSIRDLIYFSLTPFTYFISPKNAFILKNKIGYNKKSKSTYRL